MLVLPGTHSKWVRHGEGTIAGFHTFMTGEIFAALRDHTILGRLLPAGAQGSEAAFDAGVTAMRAQAGPVCSMRPFLPAAGRFLGNSPPKTLPNTSQGW